MFALPHYFKIIQYKQNNLMFLDAHAWFGPPLTTTTQNIIIATVSPFQWYANLFFQHQFFKYSFC